MYVIAVIRYRKPLEEVLTAIEPHRAYLRSLKEKGLLLASGPFEPRFGGGVLLRLPDGTKDADLLRLRDDDPFVQRGLAQWELWPWNPVIGKEDLDRA
ncbi:MAG TPA: YciI family protein [Anaeromyxobacteraceae bacterium]|nr:YciI family protein [Anaeromyxobacteraceae bacterium]